ncbi:hypothetical protein TWF281_005928 [Arthrobotrys megalospora]
MQLSTLLTVAILALSSTTLAAPAPVPEGTRPYSHVLKDYRQPAKRAPPQAKTTGAFRHFNLLGFNSKKFGNA